MIELDVKEYCQDCDGFEPVVSDNDIHSGDSVFKSLKVVSCRYQKRCSAMYNHLVRVFNNKMKEN